MTSLNKNQTSKEQVPSTNRFLLLEFDDLRLQQSFLFLREFLATQEISVAFVELLSKSRLLLEMSLHLLRLLLTQLIEIFLHHPILLVLALQVQQALLASHTHWLHELFINYYN